MHISVFGAPDFSLVAKESETGDVPCPILGSVHLAGLNSEAAAFGLPALVRATDGLQETVQEGVTGYALPVEDNGELLAARALDLMNNYENSAKASFAEYETRLNWRTGVEKLVAVLRKAAGK